MTKFYDATKEFTPFERKEGGSTGRHPRPRIGSTAKRAARNSRRVAEPVKAPVKKKK